MSAARKKARASIRRQNNSRGGIRHEEVTHRRRHLVVVRCRFIRAGTGHAQTRAPSPSSRAPHAQARCQVRPRRIHRAGRSGTFWGLPRTSRREKCAPSAPVRIDPEQRLQAIVVVLARQVLQRVTRDVRVTALPGLPAEWLAHRAPSRVDTTHVDGRMVVNNREGERRSKRGVSLANSETTNLTAFSGGIAPVRSKDSCSCATSAASSSLRFGSTSRICSMQRVTQIEGGNFLGCVASMFTSRTSRNTGGLFDRNPIKVQDRGHQRGDVGAPPK